jgi:hypothetical protein
MVKDLLVEARELHGDTVRCSICMLARVHTGRVYEAEATVWDENNATVARSRGRLIVCPNCRLDFDAADTMLDADNTFRDSRELYEEEQRERERLCIEEERRQNMERDDPDGGPWVKPPKHLTFPRK